MIRARMMREMSALEFDEWQAAYRIEPWGEIRADARHGVLVANIVNTFINLWSKKKAKYKPVDFIPKWGGRRSGKKRQPMKVQKAIMHGLYMAFGGEEAERKKKLKEKEDGKDR